jgi:hypothetical protein
MDLIYGKQAAAGQNPTEQEPVREPEAVTPRVTEEVLSKALQTLRDYKEAKSSRESRVKDEELWWQLRHWEAIRKERDPEAPEPASAWLFNSLCSKHADAMDNYPEPDVLPRESGDEQEAHKLSSILPCIMEACGFEETYSDEWWRKLKHGLAIYFVGYDPTKENGLGDVDIHGLDEFNVYWEPGIKNIQDSRNLFITSLVDIDLLEQSYPEFKGRFGSALVNDFSYSYDQTVKTDNKALVVDWYRKVPSEGGKSLLQLVKFCDPACALFSSEDYQAEDGSFPYRERGYYDHGMYPVVFDALYPEEGTPCGFGLIAVTKSPQLYIDKLSGNILEHSLLGTKVRYMASASADINEDELKDANVAVVHSALSQLDDAHVRPITVPSLDGNYINVLQSKIDEMKETSANRDFNNGSTASGVTAAAAIAALQESGSKISRDMLQASYRAYKRICEMVVEVIRQFYDETREFRITGEDGGYKFEQFSNAGIKDQVTIQALTGRQMARRPVFDLKIKPQKRSPFSIEAQYERAKELYGLGFFAPERAQESLTALSMMDFEGKDKIVQQVQQGQTMYNLLQQAMAQLAVYQGAAAAVQQTSGGGQSSGTGDAPSSSGGQTLSAAQAAAAKASMTGYGQKLAQRSKPDMSGGAAQ